MLKTIQLSLFLSNEQLILFFKMILKASPPCQTRKGSFGISQITSYLAGAVGSATLLAASQAEAAVTAITFGFGSVLDHSDASGDFSVGGFGVLRVGVYPDAILLGGRLHYGGGSFYNDGNFSPANPPIGLPYFFNNGTVLGAGTFASKISGNTWLEHGIPQISLSSNQLNKNIGFVTSTGNFGWANVNWDASAKALTINSAYVESVANTPITIGVAAVPEPSRALLALAGLSGVALRRRRKQAA